MEEKIHGLSFSAAYNFDSGLILSGNYNFIDETEKILASDIESGEVGTSRPRNRYKMTLNHPRAFNNSLGYSISARYTDEYWFNGYNWYGVSKVGGNLNIDSQFSYILPEQNLLIKAGINNMLAKAYSVTVNSPKVGTTFYLAVEYDGLIK